VGRTLIGRRQASVSEERFWALKDVSFKVGEGDRIGIVGRNGAGKSTLLKLLSRIAEPTTGKIRIRGRLASLLEVGTGFNPELTGRENIFLNGAILGMSKAEISRRFDDIVAFAEVEKFLDTPVKRYSSGMYMRLAFGVAAHLEPEILVVDEVLAVGDAQFQKKCLGKMGELSQSGRTILFVTHNMDAMVALCNRGIVLNQGGLVFDGDAVDARNQYLSNVGEMKFSIENNGGRGGSGGAAIESVRVGVNRLGGGDASIVSGEGVSVEILCRVGTQYAGRGDLQIAIGIDTVEGQRTYTYISSWDGIEIKVINNKIHVECSIDSFPFVAGRYLVSATILFQGETLDSVQHCASFWVTPKPREVHVERSNGWGVVDLPCKISNI
jgi:lipopolysaccharide transport system ATP-binding protein